MNRAERRARAKKVKNYLKNNWFMKQGVSFAHKAGRTIDIHALTKTINQDKLAKHNRRIKSAQETKTEHDIEAEVISMLLSKPGDSFYPVINPRNKKWRQTLGLREDKGYYWNLWAAIRGIAKAAWKRQSREDMLTYLFSNDIARRYGLNKGRQRNPYKRGDKDTSTSAFAKREIITGKQQELITLDDDTDQQEIYDGAQTGQDHQKAYRQIDIDQVEMQDLYQRFLAIYQQMPRVDQLVFQCDSAKDFEAGYQRVKDHLSREGITTYIGAKKRHERLLKQNPELAEIKKALKY